MYAGREEMLERFSEAELFQLTDLDGLTGAIVESKLAAAVQDAVNLIHGYLADRYSLPLNPVPALAVRWTCDLARWFLQPHSAPEMVKANYERTLAELKATAAGEIKLDAPEKASGLFSGTAEIIAPPREFSGLKGF
ncbi:DUF1320 domain-containing protein [Deltaproteobacteria bacterium Smac51]|nr:DUF1320 domain-containing protein [Deltaproteobacteria bacterium Smac51]UQZ90512.1 DUF1320 domain-containing protein [Deltaproteobacteria bacterium Smac51]